jgi:hypothetical protein
MAGVADPARVLAIPPQNRWPRDRTSVGGDYAQQSVTISSDGRRATVSFVGAAAGTGPCTAEYLADVAQSSTAIAVSIRAVAAADPAVACPAVGYSRSVTISLNPSLGNRVIIDAQGAPLPST